MTDSTPHGQAYGHGGFYPGYHSQLIYFPDHQIAVAMQINSDKSAVAKHAMALATVVIEAMNEMPDWNTSDRRNIDCQQFFYVAIGSAFDSGY